MLIFTSEQEDRQVCFIHMPNKIWIELSLKLIGGNLSNN